MDWNIPDYLKSFEKTMNLFSKVLFLTILNSLEIRNVDSFGKKGRVGVDKIDGQCWIFGGAQRTKINFGGVKTIGVNDR